jgi:hypothetical protein
MTTKSDEKNMLTKVDCDICCDEKFERHMIECPFCSFSSCKNCVETFLMRIIDDKPRCMSTKCKKVWGFGFLAENFSTKFHNKQYRERRVMLLLEKEKSLLPATQELVAEEIRYQKKRKKIQALAEQNNMYKQLIKHNKQKIVDINNEYYYSSNSIPKKQSKRFTRGCPVEECRGFLSTSLKCGVCSTYACKDCHIPKRSKNEEHKCDPDLVATIKLLKNDTKPCPACATPIYKIDGCDQIWCTTCHTAFSWISGAIERGVVHNPHFYEYQRKLNGGVAPRVRGDMRCGGVPSIINILSSLYTKLDKNNCSDAHRLLNHITHVELAKYPVIVGETDNSKLRVDYMLKRIDEKKWIFKLKKDMKKHEKNKEINDILTMFITTLTDIFGNIIAHSNNHKEINNDIKSMQILRNYTNKALKKIVHRFGNTSPCINYNWKFVSNGKNVD